jgi:hypothetical protein
MSLSLIKLPMTLAAAAVVCASVLAPGPSAGPVAASHVRLANARLCALEKPLVAPAAVGVIEILGDYVHVTSGDASAHGWYEQGPGDPAGPVTIKVQLQAMEGPCGTWVNIGAPGVGTVKHPGGGSGNRVNVRTKCAGTGSFTWRSVVSGHTAGEVYGQPAYTAPRPLKCTP